MSPVRSVTLPEELRSRFDYVQRVAFVCGALGLALLILLSFHSEHTRVKFFRSYLFAFDSAGLPGDFDDASSDGRLVGISDTAAAGSRDEDAVRDGDFVHPSAA